MPADDPRRAPRHGRRRGTPREPRPHAPSPWEQSASEENPWLQSPLAESWLQEAGWDFEETEGEDAWSTGDAVRRFSVLADGPAGASLAPRPGRDAAPHAAAQATAPEAAGPPLASASSDWEQAAHPEAAPTDAAAAEVTQPTPAQAAPPAAIGAHDAVAPAADADTPAETIVPPTSQATPRAEARGEAQGSAVPSAPVDSRTVIPRFRRELHGLRAFALLLVAAYHIWFGRVSGGVDVFLFLSAFFLTGTFVRRLDNGRPLAVPRYWLHTFKRLLPPAAITIALTLLGTALLLPRSLWPSVIQQAVASATYWQNYLLIQEAVDYQARDAGSASPLQHFWSLAAQGQVFLLWPLLFLLALPAARRGRSARAVLAGVFGVILAASLAWSVISTAAQQPVAYFDTLTRLWEFALGSLLALAMPYIDRFLGARRPEEQLRPRLPALRALLGWAGIASLLACGIVLDVAPLFPGWVAIWPTAAAGLVIIAGHSGARWGADRLLSTGVFALLGDISYALYLVHWPLLVFWLASSDQARAGLWDGLALLAVSIVVAWVLTRVVDAPIRRSAWLRTSALRSAIAVAASITLVVGAASGWRATLPRTVPSEPAPVSAVPSDASTILTSTPADLRPLGHELPSQWPNLPHDCAGDWSVGRQLRGMDCEMLQPAGADVEGLVVILGSSHARQFAPALAAWAREHQWQVVNLHMDTCDFAADPEATPRCRQYPGYAMEQVRALAPDAVLTTATRTSPSTAPETLIPGQEALLRQLVADGIDVLAVRDTPRWREDPYSCAEAVLDEGGTPMTADEQCGAAANLKRALDSPLPALAELSTEDARVIPLDFTDLICPADRCAPILGPRYVYMDDNHLTELFVAEVLAPRMIEDLDAQQYPGSATG